MKKTYKYLLALLLFLSVFTTITISADRYAVANGNWNATSTWSASEGGASGASVPVAGDIVYIMQGATNRTVTIPSGYSAACLTLHIGNNTTMSTYILTITDNTSSLSVGDNLLFYGPSGSANRQMDVNAGTVNVGGNLRLGNLQTGTQATRVCKITITTGTVTVAGNLIYYNVAGSSPLQTQIDMSGGAGTFNAGRAFIVNNNSGTLTPGTTSTFNFNRSIVDTAIISIPIGISSVVYNNLNTNVTGGRGAALSNAITPTNVTGNLQVQSGILYNGGFEITLASNKNFSVSNGATFNLTGTSGMVTVSGTGTKTFGPTSTVNYAGASQAVINESYGHLTLSGSGTATLPGTAMTISGNFATPGTISTTASANLNVNGNFTIGSETSFDAGALSHSVKGNWTNSGTFIASTSTVTFNGTEAQSLTGSTTFYTVALDNLNDLSLNADITVNNQLTLTNGSIKTSTNSVILTSGSSVSRTNGQVIGNLMKNLTAGLITYELGTSNGYTPVTLNVTGSGNFTISSVESKHPNRIGENVLNMYWILTNGGITSADITFNYLDSDVNGTEAEYTIGRYSSGWTFPGGTVNPSTNQAAINGVSSFSDWVMGESSALPVELSSFSAILLENSVKLVWRTETEVSNYGFEIERASSSTTPLQDWMEIGFVQGHGNSNSPKEYSFMDESVSGGKYSYRLKQIDTDGKFEYSKVIEVDLGSPAKFELSQNYPNPFNPATTIRFALSESGNIKLTLYNIVGEQVSILVNEFKDKGVHTINFNAESLPSGLYIYNIEANGFTQSRKMTLIK